MKKRMLITSIVMVVVLAVALTTSSLAWFSASQNDVTATGGSFQASATSSTNVNIAISDELASFRSSVAFASKTAQMIPVCPTAAITDFPASLSLNTRQIINDRFAMENQESKQTITFDAADGGVTVTKDGSAYYYQDALYVVNYDDTKNVSKFTLKIESNVTAIGSYAAATPVMLVRLAKRGKNDTSWTKVDYKVVLLTTTGGLTGYCAYDFSTLTPSSDTKVSEQTTADVKNDKTATICDANAEGGDYAQTVSLDFDGVDLAVSEGEYLKIDIVMWFDGNALTAATQQTNVEFKMTVTGA